jgi:hypothetical protein
MKCAELLLAACAIGYSVTGNAVTVKGMKSCGAWIEDRAEQPAPSLGAIADCMVGWIPQWGGGSQKYRFFERRR